MSSRRARVVIEEPTEPWTSANAAKVIPGGRALDQFVLNPLVIALAVVMRDVLRDRLPQMTFAEGESRG